MPEAIVLRERETSAAPTTLPSDLLPAAQPLTPMQMAYQLIARGSSLDAVKEMLAVGREIERDQARREFAAAIAEAKAEIKPIVKNREGHNSRYADFAAIASEVDPVLSRHGLSYRHRSEVAERTITVICRLEHKAGHFEETALPAPPDTSGAKNAIQAIGSTLTYLQRYTLLLALGLATAADDDGRAAGGSETLSDEQVATLNELIDQAITATKSERSAYWANFLAFMKAPSLAEIPAAKYQAAVRAVKGHIAGAAK